MKALRDRLTNDRGDGDLALIIIVVALLLIGLGTTLAAQRERAGLAGRLHNAQRVEQAVAEQLDATVAEQLDATVVEHGDVPSKSGAWHDLVIKRDGELVTCTAAIDTEHEVTLNCKN